MKESNSENQISDPKTTIPTHVSDYRSEIFDQGRRKRLHTVDIE